MGGIDSSIYYIKMRVKLVDACEVIQRKSDSIDGCPDCGIGDNFKQFDYSGHSCLVCLNCYKSIYFSAGKTVFVVQRQ